MLLEVRDELPFGRRVEVRHRQLVRQPERRLGMKQVRARPVRSADRLVRSLVEPVPRHHVRELQVAVGENECEARQRAFGLPHPIRHSACMLRPPIRQPGLQQCQVVLVGAEKGGQLALVRRRSAV